MIVDVDVFDVNDLMMNENYQMMYLYKKNVNLMMMMNDDDGDDDDVVDDYYVFFVLMMMLQMLIENHDYPHRHPLIFFH